MGRLLEKGAVRKRKRFWQLSHYISARLGMCLASWQENKTSLDTKPSPAAAFYTSQYEAAVHTFPTTAEVH